MADKISSYNRPDLNISRSTARSTEKVQDGAQTRDKGSSPAAQDAVSLSDTSTKLQKIEARLATLPEVDRSRVEAVKERIQSGSYQVNPEQVAEKLIGMDKGLV